VQVAVAHREAEAQRADNELRATVDQVGRGAGAAALGCDDDLGVGDRTQRCGGGVDREQVGHGLGTEQDRPHHLGQAQPQLRGDDEMAGRRGHGADADPGRHHTADADVDVVGGRQRGRAEHLREHGQPGLALVLRAHDVDEPLPQPGHALIDELGHGQRGDGTVVITQPQ